MWWWWHCYADFLNTLSFLFSRQYISPQKINTIRFQIVYRWKKFKSFVFLGNEVNSNGKIENEIKRRIYNSSKFYNMVKGIIRNKEVPKECKMTIRKVYFIPMLLYSGETCSVTRRSWSKLQKMEMKFLREESEGRRGQIASGMLK